ncbi:hypothetical protein L1987_55332 [Smallanthus sonchifolius]|uniref:Uncharacterized protein n=1 Tax=Smallanthus sonchifolius TaxID=185202 RepID=A0ACB9E995_9ASTR|nr:hypothetical protein L1987_55332 [Smallanthus sonchifolius]
MDPQLLMPSPAADFNFDSTSTSPYATAPSSPNILFPKFFYATPTNQKNEDLEEADHMDFAFDFSGQLEWPSISDADELFDGGKIKPLELTPSPYSPNEIHRQINMPSKISLIATELFTESENSIPKRFSHDLREVSRRR